MKTSLSAGVKRSSMNLQTSRRWTARGSESLKPLTAIIDSPAKWPSSLEFVRPLPTSAIADGCR